MCFVTVRIEPGLARSGLTAAAPAQSVCDDE
jgi:hypothetical protein